MKNTEIKQRFLSKIKKKDQDAKRLINIAGVYEDQYKKDVCQFNEDELRGFLQENTGPDKILIYRAIEVLGQYERYIRHIRSEFKPSDARGKIEISETDICRATMFASPKHLASELDRVFEPLEEHNADMLYRCFIWLSYAEMPDNEIVLLKKKDFDFMAREVISNGKRYKMYEESVKTLMLAHELDAFKVRVTKGDAIIERTNPEYMFSGMERGDYNPEGKLRSIRSRISETSLAGGASFSYVNVRSSGMFYRIYEKERSMLVKDVEKEFVFFDKRGKIHESAQKRARQSMLEKYRVWKQTFQIQ